MAWPRFSGAPVRFGVRSLRHGILADVRTELEAALGVRFVPDETDHELAFTCVMPACEMHLGSWLSEAPELHVFNFIGSPSAAAGEIPPAGEAISDVLAMHLRDAGGDWYVPDKLEFLEEAGVLGDRLLDPTVLVSILAPPWLAGVSEEERHAGVTLLESIARGWLSLARSSANPLADVKARKIDLQRRYVPADLRLGVLTSYVDEACRRGIAR